MGFTVTRKKGLVTMVDLKNLRGYKREFKKLLEGPVLEAAAWELQRRVSWKMASVYANTKKDRTYYNKKYLAKGKSEKIEERLFGGSVEGFLTSIAAPGSKPGSMPKPRRLSKTRFEVRVLNDYDGLKRDLPHLKWQEKGTSSNDDQQPYLVTRNGLRSITKKKAEGVKSDNPNLIKYITVPHYALPARRFILSARMLMKSQGKKIVRDAVGKEMKKRLAKFVGKK